jgi:hypothetical protein
MYRFRFHPFRRRTRIKTMNRFTQLLLGALAIGCLARPALAQVTYDLTLDGQGGTPASGTGIITIDTAPPGNNTSGVYLESLPGNDLLSMSFTLGADTFDLGNELAPSDVVFDTSGDLLSISYNGTDNGDLLSITGLSYQDIGANALTVNGAVSLTAVPEPASMAMLGAGLLTLSALRRRRNS